MPQRTRTFQVNWSLKVHNAPKTTIANFGIIQIITSLIIDIHCWFCQIKSNGQFDNKS